MVNLILLRLRLFVILNEILFQKIGCRGQKLSLKAALKFTHEREYGKGGFTLYRYNPDTKNTYYGAKIRKTFNEEPYNK